MKLPLQVSFHGIDRSEALENLIAKEVEGLHKFDADLISCRVAVESEGRHQNQGRECSVRVSLNAPGHEFIMNTKNEDAHAAVRAAFDSLARQVKDNAAKRRGSGPWGRSACRPSMSTTTISWRTPTPCPSPAR